MAETVRPRRSVLYMPGSNTRALEKGKTLPADALILDLEDSVTPDAKAEARRQVCAAVKAGGYGRREVVVRVNGLHTPWGRDDLVQVSEAGPDAVLLPKLVSVGMVREAERLMEQHGAPENMALWCMMETPLDVLHAEEIASSGPRIACLVVGSSDLTKDLHASHTAERLPLLTSMGLCLLAARAYGLAILDGVHLDLADDEGFARACRQGAELGFDGKTLIHPKTIAVANEAFSPSVEDVAWSRRIIAAHAEAAAEGKGVVVVDGKLVEALHVEGARRLVALAEAIEELEQAASS
jgi:citrate lyase subunit beta/citryl-CoA lyase